MAVAEAPVVAPLKPAVPVRSWLAVLAVAAATFAMVTVETLPVGLLTPIGRTFDVSDGAAALTVTLPGLMATLAAPLLPVGIGRMDRRTVLLGLMALMLAGTVISGTAPNFGVLLVSRAIVGVAIGGFWALAASVAVRLVPPQHIPKALSLAFGGATAANVLGAPAATLLGGLTNWRVAAVAVAVLGAGVGLVLRAVLPALPATEALRPRKLIGQLRNPAVRAGVAATFLLVGGHWGAYAFIRPILQDTSGLSAGAIGPAQLAFGTAAVVGTFAAGTFAGKDPRKVLIVTGLLLTISLAAFTTVGSTAIGGIALLLVWGLSFGAIPVGVQSWILRATPASDAEAATALNTTAYNFAIAAGTAAGGLIVNAAGTGAVLSSAAVLAVLAIVAVASAGRTLTRAEG